MRAIVLYRPNTDHTRTVEEFSRDYNKQTANELELVNIDTIQGSSMAELYGIMAYPAILILDTTGQLMKQWEGLPLPLINEVAGMYRA